VGGGWLVGARPAAHRWTQPSHPAVARCQWVTSERRQDRQQVSTSQTTDHIVVNHASSFNRIH